MQVRDAQSGRLQGWMYVSQASRKYDGVKFPAHVPSKAPRAGSDPSWADPTLLRWFVVYLPFREFQHKSGRVERVLSNAHYTPAMLECTGQFWQADEEDY